MVGPDQVVDPGGRDGCRAPLPWSPDPGHGWPGSAPWLPWSPDPVGRSASVQRHDPTSVLALYRRMLATKAGSPAVRLGEQALLDAPDDVLVWRRRHGDDERVVAVSFAPAPVAVPGLVGTVEIASDGVGEGGPFDGTLGPDQAVVLRTGG